MAEQAFSNFAAGGSFDAMSNVEEADPFGLPMSMVDATNADGSCLPQASADNGLLHFIGAGLPNSLDQSAINVHDPSIAGQAPGPPCSADDVYDFHLMNGHQMNNGQIGPGMLPAKAPIGGNGVPDAQDYWVPQSQNSYQTKILQIDTAFPQPEPQNAFYSAGSTTLTSPSTATPVTQASLPDQWPRHHSDPMQQFPAHQPRLPVFGPGSTAFINPFRQGPSLLPGTPNLPANEQIPSGWMNSQLQGPTHAQQPPFGGNTPADYRQYPPLPFRHSMPGVMSNGLISNSHAAMYVGMRPLGLTDQDDCKPNQDDGRSRENRKRKRETVQTEEEKRDVFLQRNRQAAAKCRSKKKARDGKTLSLKRMLANQNEGLRLEFEELVRLLMSTKDDLLRDVAGHDCQNEAVKKWVAYSTSEEGKRAFKKMIADPSEDPTLKERKRQLAKLEKNCDMDDEFEAEFANELEEEDNKSRKPARERLGQQQGEVEAEDAAIDGMQNTAVEQQGHYDHAASSTSPAPLAGSD